MSSSEPSAVDVAAALDRCGKCGTLIPDVTATSAVMAYDGPYCNMKCLLGSMQDCEPCRRLTDTITRLPANEMTAVSKGISGATYIVFRCEKHVISPKTPLTTPLSTVRSIDTPPAPAAASSSDSVPLSAGNDAVVLPKEPVVEWKPRHKQASFLVSARMEDTMFCMKYRIKMLDTGKERLAKPVEVESMYRTEGYNDIWV